MLLRTPCIALYLIISVIFVTIQFWFLSCHIEKTNDHGTFSVASSLARHVIDEVGQVDKDYEEVLNNTSLSGNAFLHKHGTKSQPLDFVMHIGPPKTGTTTIQCALRDLEDDLAADNYVVMETQSCRPSDQHLRSKGFSLSEMMKNGATTYENIAAGRSTVSKCFQQWRSDQRGMPPCWETGYMEFISEQRRRNKSIILSSEHIAMTKQNITDDLVESLNGFRVVVIATYRRWFDWIISAHNQENKGLHRKWPDQGGGKIVSLERHISESLRDRKSGLGEIRNWWDAFVDNAVEKFRGHPGIDLRILNMHEGGITNNFFCDGLTGSSTACSSAKSLGKAQDTYKNMAANSLWFDSLAVKAHEKGLVGESLSRQDVADLAQVFQVVELGLDPTDFPKVCPSVEVLDNILAESLRAERLIMPPHKHKELDSSHRAAFEAAVLADKFCTIDSDKVLEDARWLWLFSRTRT